MSDCTGTHSILTADYLNQMGFFTAIAVTALAINNARLRRQVRQGVEDVELAGSVIDDLERDLARVDREFTRHKRMADAARDLCDLQFRAGNWDRCER